MVALSLPFTLDKLLIKPPYLLVQSGSRLIGNFGHSTAIFKRPIIEGQYFLEFKVREDSPKDKIVSYRSALRIGICTHSFNTSFPLGYGDSIAYKSVDGSLIRSGDILGRYGGFKVGDTVGIYLSMSPPHKNPDPEKVS